MRKVYILGGLRSYVAVENKGYKKIPAELLSAGILAEIKNRFIPSDGLPDCVICGNSVGGGSNIARLSLLSARFPQSVFGYSVDAQCASGLEALLNGYAQIASGLADCVIAGGAESASTQPVRSYNKNHPNFAKGYREYSTAQFIPDKIGDSVMIEGADETARHNNITADMTEDFIIESHKRALTAQKSGILNDIIFPIFGLTKDESIRKNISKRLIQRAHPILDGGITTAASSCTKNDGAAYLVLCSEDYLRKHNLNAEFRIVSGANTAGDGLRSPEAIFTAIPEVIKKSGLTLNRIDRIDYNEAFAVIDVLYNQRYNLPSNQFGGALAYGHPYGATGALLTLHLMKAMQVNNEQFGICAVPAAGGISCALLIERDKN